MAAPTRVLSLNEGPTTFSYALLDPVNVDDSDSTSRAGSQTTTSCFLKQEPVSKTMVILLRLINVILKVSKLRNWLQLFIELSVCLSVVHG